MWKLFYIFYLLRNINQNTPPQENSPPSFNSHTSLVFTETLKQCIGQTVTVFVIGGGYGGSGYTGVLLGVKEEYISIYINPLTLAEVPISKIVGFSHNML
ncbi:MAG: hypothetical protein GX272_04590 [Epulopiscium sp.]|nr:hypothetical protein [Candidatus Epulonipiscium sp.]